VDTCWDDWMRLPEHRKGRQFIRPELCRTYNFGEVVSCPTTTATPSHHVARPQCLVAGTPGDSCCTDRSFAIPGCRGCVGTVQHSSTLVRHLPAGVLPPLWLQGSSQGQFYRDFLKPIQLNTVRVSSHGPWLPLARCAPPTALCASPPSALLPPPPLSAQQANCP